MSTTADYEVAKQLVQQFEDVDCRIDGIQLKAGTKTNLQIKVATALSQARTDALVSAADIAKGFELTVKEPRSTIMPTDHVRGQKYAANKIEAAIRSLAKKEKR
jgi:hypothetical protein